MVSAAEQMAANLNWGSIGKAKDLQNRILYALLLLIIYRAGTYVPVPGVDAEQLKAFFEQNAQGIGGMLNMFTGGAVGRMAVFALGIMPYITSSIIMQLLTSMVPYLEQLKKEGEQGRQKINQYTRYGTVILAFFQAWGIAAGIESQGLASEPGLFFRVSCVVTLVGGTMLLMWLGEQITQRGIGNGISLIIYVGIIAELPGALGQFFASGRSGALSAFTIIFLILVVIAVMADDGLRGGAHVVNEVKQLAPVGVAAESVNGDQFDADFDHFSAAIDEHRYFAKALLQATAEGTFRLVTNEAQRVAGLRSPVLEVLHDWASVHHTRSRKHDARACVHDDGFPQLTPLNWAEPFAGEGILAVVGEQ